MGGTSPAAGTSSRERLVRHHLLGDRVGNIAQGNYIGTTRGHAPVGNGAGCVLVYTSGPATVGGSAPGAGNLIAARAVWDGVAIMGGTGHAVLGNTIHSNVEQSIDIDDNGITANDYDPIPGTAPFTHDSDGGVNAHQNFPVLASAATTGTQIAIVGTLSSTTSTNFRIEFFANPPPTAKPGAISGSPTSPPTRPASRW